MHVHNSPNVEKRFIISISLTSLILIAEVVGGIWTHSLALLSDSAHVFMDIFALALSYVALKISARPSDDQHSFGYHRVEVLAALVNGVSLLVIAGGIFYEAVKRWQQPLEIRSTEMLIIAVIGLVVNLVVAFVLGGHAHEHDHGHAHEGEEKQEHEPVKRKDLNIYSAFLHVLGDAVSSLGVIIAAILIQITHASWLDPLVSILIGGILLVSSYRLIRSSLHILIEGVPEGLSVNELKKQISGLPAVQEVHDLHVWNLCSGAVSLSAHIVLKQEMNNNGIQVTQSINQMLKKNYAIDHTTIQIEQEPCNSGSGCN